MNTTNIEMQRLREENQKLRADNEALSAKALRYATFGDFMKTLVMLPLSDTRKTDDFSAKVEVALMVHGIDSRSAEGESIKSFFIRLMKPEREKLVRAFVAAGDERERMHTERLTPGCSCALCASVESADKIRQAEYRGRMPRPTTDHFLTKSLNRGETEEDKQGVQETARNLLDLADEMGLGGPSAGGVLGALFEMLLGGPPGGRRGRGRGGIPGLDIQVMELGGGDLPPELRRILGGGDEG